MTNYRKAITYDKFMALSPEERKDHSTYFLKQKPDICPVIIKVEHGGKPLEIKMCKFLIYTNTTMREQQEFLRTRIIQHSQGGLTSKDSIFFWYNKKHLDPKVLVKDFLKFEFKDNEKDGWLHLLVTTQQTMGGQFSER